MSVCVRCLCLRNSLLKEFQIGYCISVSDTSTVFCLLLIRTLLRTLPVVLSTVLTSTLSEFRLLTSVCTTLTLTASSMCTGDEWHLRLCIDRLLSVSYTEPQPSTTTEPQPSAHVTHVTTDLRLRTFLNCFDIGLVNVTRLTRFLLQ